MKTILVALGGNAIKQASEQGTMEEQLHNCRVTAASIGKIIQSLDRGDRLVITHGNGPQAGNLMVQQEAAKEMVPSQPMDVVGAMTQGQIGYMLQQSLINILKDLGLERPICAVVNQVVVDGGDPEFSGETASKPVGNFLTEAEVVELKKKYPDYIFKKVRPSTERCWRRTVPSPDPISNVENKAIKMMVDSGITVIASGGGGIPVIEDGDGHYRGIEAVIDKDLAGEKLAEVVGADVLLILTDVEKAKLDFGKPDERSIGEMTLEEARKHLEEGQFLAGSMGPKVKACIRFLEWGGQRAIITSLDRAAEGLKGQTGTIISAR